MSNIPPKIRTEERKLQKKEKLRTSKVNNFIQRLLKYKGSLKFTKNENLHFLKTGQDEKCGIL